MRITAIVAAVLFAGPALLTPSADSPPQSAWQLVVLGIAQDAGIPQLGCEQELCRSIRAGKRKRIGRIAVEVVQPGHRLMVQVQSSWFPLYDRNPQTFVPNIFFAGPQDYRTATQKVFTGAQGTWIGLPVVK